MNRIAFELPLILFVGMPLALAAVAVLSWRQVRQGENSRQALVSAVLRAAALLVVVPLAARPVRVDPTRTQDNPKLRKHIVVLIDRSASMSLEDGGTTRAAQVNTFARERLLPALEHSRLDVEALLFAENALRVNTAKMSTARPDGKRTNLAGTIAQALTSTSKPPLAVIALTDGAANDRRDNPRALAGLLEARVPFVGIGFGTETGVRTLSLNQASAPSIVPPKQVFQISAQLEMSTDREMPPFDLLLLGHGRVLGKKTISAGKGQRLWLESFRVVETAEGPETYSVQLVPPHVEGLRCLETMATVNVRVTSEKEFRILFAEGALSWDYKFIRMALEGDPSLQLTGLIRTANRSYFHQDVKTEAELRTGFPSTLEELAPFRVVVLSSFAPADLTTGQQEVLKRFCGDGGGGVLMIGGPETFDAAWRSSPLEPLLPVKLDSPSSPAYATMPFRVQLTNDALENPVFEISDRGSSRRAWGKLPTFTRYAPVAAAKPGAQVWAVHPQDRGSDGRPRILMAQQRYGAGMSAVICVQSLWRWRLAKESDPKEFDRFWQQLLRYLGEQGRQPVTIRLPDQDLRPQADIRVTVERTRDPRSPRGRLSYQLQIDDPRKGILKSQTVELASGQSAEILFRPPTAGVYTVTVRDARGALVASRPVEIRESNIEFQNAARNMDMLAQWANLSGGVAVKAEDCRDPGEIISRLRSQTEPPTRVRSRRPPAGMNAWVMAVILACLCTEWALRKRWGMP